MVFDDEEEKATVCGLAEKHEISKNMAKLSIKPRRMKVRRSKRIVEMPRIDYQESPVRSGASIHSSEDQLMSFSDSRNSKTKEVNSITNVPRFNTYNVGARDGVNCCSECRKSHLC